MAEQNMEDSKGEVLKLQESTHEIQIDLSKPKTIKVWGYDKKGQKTVRRLRVTEKRKIFLY